MLKSYSQINCQKNQMRSSRFLQYFSMRCMFFKKFFFQMNNCNSAHFFLKKKPFFIFSYKEYNTKVNRDLLIFKTTNKSQMTGKTSISAYFLPSTVYFLLISSFTQRTESITSFDSESQTAKFCSFGRQKSLFQRYFI